MNNSFYEMRYVMTYEDAILKILCEINNRLTDVAITLQAVGILNATQEDSVRQEWINKLSKMLLTQKEGYATLNVS